MLLTSYRGEGLLIVAAIDCVSTQHENNRRKRKECLRRGLVYLEPSITELGDGKNFC